MSTAETVAQPIPLSFGRLADPNRDLSTDSRADPRMVAALAPFGLHKAPAPTPVTVDSTLEEKYAYIDAAEPGYDQVFAQLLEGLPPVSGVDTSTVQIKGVDDNDIALYIHKPSNAQGPVPCIYHIHGGGMVLLAASDTNYVRWRNELAASGLVVVGVEFRNGAGKLGNHPFPAGLNDCMSGLQWVAQNREQLGASGIVVSGESGGGNLTLALTLKAKQEGKLGLISGAYGMCPYISNAYANKLASLPSLYENDCYFLDCANMGAIASLYDPEHGNATNPLAWPYYATQQDLEGLPPHVISVNELDPLRDEGLEYYRNLLLAGVQVYSRTVNGTCHAGDMLFRKAMPEVFAATVQDIKGFADSVCL